MSQSTRYTKKEKSNLCITYKWRKNVGGRNFNVARSDMPGKERFVYITLRIYSPGKGLVKQYNLNMLQIFYFIPI